MSEGERMSGDRAPNGQSALAGITVVEFAGPLGSYCGKMFADLGAAVILVEPPGGAAIRGKAPFTGTGAEQISLPFIYENGGKKSIALDLEDCDDRKEAMHLVERADLLIESFRPGVMAQYGLGYDRIRERNPSLVNMSISLFGQDGPYADFEGDDLTLMAMGGMLYLAGYPDTPPVVAYGEQAFGAASQFAAIAALAAILRAEVTGRGEQIDVSVQEAVTMGLENAAQLYELTGQVRRRGALAAAQAGIGMIPCKDGYVFALAFGVGETGQRQNLIKWLTAEGVAGVEALQDGCWDRSEFYFTNAAKEIFDSIFCPFARERTRKELYDGAQKYRVALAPVNTPADVLQSVQLNSREFFLISNVGEAGTPFQMPGAPYKLSVTPWRRAGSVPGLDEHRAELADIGGRDVAVDRGK